MVIFFGYTFLSEYYERFGIRFQDIPVDTSHMVMRVLELIFYRYELAMLFFSIIVMASLSFTRFSFNLGFVRLPSFALFSGLTVVGAFIAFWVIQAIANDFAERDINPRTSALRQLVCIRSADKPVSGWVSEQIENSRKIMLLFGSEERLVVFLAPKNPELPSPHVTIFELGISENALFSHTVSAVDIDKRVRLDSC